MHWDCCVSLLRDSNLSMPHSSTPASSLSHRPRDPFRFQLSAQAAMDRAGKIWMETPSQESATPNMELASKHGAQHRVGTQSKLRPRVLGGHAGHYMRRGWGQSQECHKDSRKMPGWSKNMSGWSLAIGSEVWWT